MERFPFGPGPEDGSWKVMGRERWEGRGDRRVGERSTRRGGGKEQGAGSRAQEQGAGGRG
eukprot:748504-Hanusia_phi.AAC.2